jgi:two-component system C4-dicarboxylate transport sensor histidine kinase DctB
MKSSINETKIICLFFRKMRIAIPAEDTDFYKFVEYTEKFVKEKDDRIKILENCLKVSSEEIKTYISELKDKSEQLSHSNRLAAIGEMSASLSHEINNPLFIISSNSDIIDMLLERVEFDNKDRISQALEKIKTTIGKIKKISASLKNISNDKNNYNKENVVVSDIISESTLLYTEQLKNKGVKFTVSFSNEKLMARMASSEFSQVMINLITNAKQATEHLVDPNQKYISINVTDDGNQMCIKVQNGGPRVPPENQEKIFESFFTTKPVGVGTGLGLSISKKIIVKMGGSLILDKNSDHPVFLISLPLKDESQEEQLFLAA